MLAAAVSSLAAVLILGLGVFLGHRLGYVQAREDMAEESYQIWRKIGRGGA